MENCMTGNDGEMWARRNRWTRSRLISFCLAAASLLWVLLASNSPLSAQVFEYPLAAASTDDKTVYVADRKLPGIWKVSDGRPEVFFRAAKEFRTPLNAIRCLAVDQQGRLLVGDSGTREVYRFNDKNQPLPLTSGGIGIPMGIAVGPTGEIFVSDLETQRIMKVPVEGGAAQVFASVPAPHGLTFDSAGRLFVVSHGKNQLLRVSAEGKVEVAVTGRRFRYPHDVAVKADGSLYVSDGYRKTVWMIAPGEEPKPWLSGEPLENPVGLAWRGDSLLVADSRAKQVFAADADGKLTPLVTAPDNE